MLRAAATDGGSTHPRYFADMARMDLRSSGGRWWGVLTVEDAPELQQRLEAVLGVPDATVAGRCKRPGIDHPWVMKTKMSSLALSCALLFAATACGDDGTDASQAAGSGADEPTTSVMIVEPADGATVSGSVEFTMAAEAFEIEPAGEVRPGAGHFHLMVDVPCVEPGTVIPADDEHLHFGDGSTTATLDLEPGERTVCLQAGDGFHSALDLTDTVTITVEE